MNKKYNIKHVYEAKLVFIEVAPGIYTVGKDKAGDYGAGKYVSQSTVITELNYTEKVAICKDTLETILHANFTIEEDNGNA